jgi:hypothetical protein
LNKVKFLHTSLEEIPEFIFNLKNEQNFTFLPSLSGVEQYGKALKLGFSTYGLKLFYMLGIWDSLNKNQQNEWIEFINSFQLKENRFQENAFIDPKYEEYYMNNSLNEKFKDVSKKFLNLLPNNNFDTFELKLSKGINAETKQAISTLFEVGSLNKAKLSNKFFSDQELLYYLKSLNWSTPWTSGAQFSSLCVYSRTQNFGQEETLKNFIKKLVNTETGSYFINKPQSSREIINGAMKVISGLNWIEEEIHSPKKLIDFCLNNTPVHEGCDVVDYIYVLTQCSMNLNYKKNEVVESLLSCIEILANLYKNDEKGFSYFQNKSQTHYYGVKITQGNNVADINGTLMCTWASLMILDLLGEKDENYNLIKP